MPSRTAAWGGGRASFSAAVKRARSHDGTAPIPDWPAVTLNDDAWSSIDLALREVRPAVEGWKVARQGQLAGGRHRVSERGGGRASPPNQQVSGSRHRRAVDEHRTRFDEHLAPAADRLAVVGHASDHHRRTSGRGGGADRHVRIDRGQLGSTDAQQHRRDRQREQRRPQQEGKTEQRHGCGDGDHSQLGMRRDQDDRQRDGDAPARR
jgi:hypothetical protein